MTHILSLIAAPGSDALDDALCRQITPVAGRWLAAGQAWEAPLAEPDPARRAAIGRAATAAIGSRPVDWAIVPALDRRKRMLVADMDATMVENETLDELAALAGVGDQVVAITARAMRGELDFHSALQARLALLEGQPEALLDATAALIRPTAGAGTLVATMRASGAYCVLVTGGFTVFAARVSGWLGFDAQIANTLVVADGRLTGQIVPPLIDGTAKRAALERVAHERGIDRQAVMAVGDGANDAPMIAAAGLGVAFRAKPILVAAADAVIRHGDLTALLYLQGYARTEFIDR